MHLEKAFLNIRELQNFKIKHFYKKGVYLKEYEVPVVVSFGYRDKECLKN